jgi:hypothetical protein
MLYFSVQEKCGYGKFDHRYNVPAIAEVTSLLYFAPPLNVSWRSRPLHPNEFK